MGIFFCAKHTERNKKQRRVDKKRKRPSADGRAQNVKRSLLVRIEGGAVYQRAFPLVFIPHKIKPPVGKLRDGGVAHVPVVKLVGEDGVFPGLAHIVAGKGADTMVWYPAGTIG